MTNEMEQAARVFLNGNDHIRGYRDSIDRFNAQAEFLAKFATEQTRELREEIERLRSALADAIRRPLGVCPDSALGLLDNDDLEAAERRR